MRLNEFTLENFANLHTNIHKEKKNRGTLQLHCSGIRMWDTAT